MLHEILMLHSFFFSQRPTSPGQDLGGENSEGPKAPPNLPLNPAQLGYQKNASRSDLWPSERPILAYSKQPLQEKGVAPPGMFLPKTKNEERASLIHFLQELWPNSCPFGHYVEKPFS